MEFKIECPWCKQHYSVDDSFVGQNVNCSICGKTFTVGNPYDSQDFNSPPPPPPRYSSPPPQNGQSMQQVVYVQVPFRAKNRGIYVMLGIFLGNLGVHDFYAGHIARGVAHLCLTLWFIVFYLGGLSKAKGEYAQYDVAKVLLTLLIAFIVNSVWVLVELIKIKNDGKGMPME